MAGCAPKAISPKSDRLPVDNSEIMALQPTSSLASYCPDLADWPASWEIDEADRVVGQRIVEALKPFLSNLLVQGLARKTLVRHRDNIWLLGGEMIRRRLEDEGFVTLTVDEWLGELVEEDGGPLIGSSISESEQDSFDVTCRKLYQFMNRDF